MDTCVYPIISSEQTQPKDRASVCEQVSHLSLIRTFCFHETLSKTFSVLLITRIQVLRPGSPHQITSCLSRVASGTDPKPDFTQSTLSPHIPLLMILCCGINLLKCSWISPPTPGPFLITPGAAHCQPPPSQGCTATATLDLRMGWKTGRADTEMTTPALRNPQKHTWLTMCRALHKFHLIC